MKDTAEADLENMRGDIDTIDHQLFALVASRIQICRRVAEYKRDHDIPMMQQDRLDLVWQRAERFAAENDMSPAFLRAVLEAITEETCRIEDAIIGGGSTGLARTARRIDHVAIAVHDLEEAIATFRDNFGFRLLERRQVHGDFSGMDSATMRAGGVTFVLCQGDSPESNVSKYIKNFGPGVQHIAIEVDQHQETLNELNERGCDLLTGIIHAPGLDQSFTRREPNSGIQVEFVTRCNNEGFHDNSVRELFSAMEREGVY